MNPQNPPILLMIICEAIKNKLLLEIDYGGGKRIVQPYIHGTNTKHKEVLSAYQLQGFSTTQQYYGWKTFEISHILAMQLTDTHFFIPQNNYKPTDQHFRRIHCRYVVA